MDRPSERAESEVVRSRVGPVALGILVSALVRFLVHAIPVASGEPGLLRWLRILAEHPVRAALLATLMLVALRPRAGSP